MSKLLKQSVLGGNITFNKNYLDRNNRPQTTKSETETRDIYFKIHEYEAGTTLLYMINMEPEAVLKETRNLRRDVAQYAVYVGIYCSVRVEYNESNKLLFCHITHDGIRYK